MPASFTSTDFTPDRLEAGTLEMVSRPITVKSGQVLLRGTLLGRTAASATAAAAVADAGNVGNGVFGAVTPGTEAKNGRYRVVFLRNVTNLGTFSVLNPGGVEVGEGVVGTAFAGDIGFTIADGSIDFQPGDAFSVDVSAVAYKYEKSASAATDGSEVPDSILIDDCDATAGDTNAAAYITGIFDDSAVIYGTGHTAASVRDGLRTRGIHLITTAGA